MSAREADGHSALCLSGGGIRSASFNLGVLQGLAQAGVLDSVDYLSTVSGGGYVGGWLTAWRTRARQTSRRIPAQMAGGLDRARRPRPEPLARLRRSTSASSIRTSACDSIDVWTLGTIILRNLLLNWVVLVPMLAAAALLPRSLSRRPRTAVAAGARVAGAPRCWYLHDWLVALPLFGIAALFAALELPSLGNRRHGQRAFVAVLPRADRARRNRHLGPPLLGVALRRRFLAALGVIVAIVGMTLPWVVGGLLSAGGGGRGRGSRRPLAGAAGRTAIWWANHALTRDGPPPSADLRRRGPADHARPAVRPDDAVCRPRQPRHDRRRP